MGKTICTNLDKIKDIARREKGLENQTQSMMNNLDPPDGQGGNRPSGMNEEGSLHVQILYDEPECFNSRMAHYGKFEYANNYIAMIRESSPDLEERCGLYGEMLVLKVQELGLNTCWVALTHGKSKAIASAGEKEVIIIQSWKRIISAKPRILCPGHGKPISNDGFEDAHLEGMALWARS